MLEPFVTEAEVPPIAPLPLAVIDLAPAAAAVVVEPPPGLLPTVATAGEPLEITLRCLVPPGGPALTGVLRWRQAGSPHWMEEPLEWNTGGRFAGRWTAPEPGNYQWTAEFWIEGEDDNRRGSCGPEGLYEVRAERAGLREGSWLVCPREPLADSTARCTETAARVLLLAPFFHLDDSGLVGRNSLGHYTIDPALGDTRDFGGLSSAAQYKGMVLAMTLPLACSPQHPFRERSPESFGADGTADLLGTDWRARWSDWEGVFRFWIVQGVELFHLPDAILAPLSFWRQLIANLRADFPAIAFSAPPPEDKTLAEQLLAAGFFCLHPVETPENSQPLMPVEELAGHDEVSCNCSHSQLRATLQPDGKGGGLLFIENTDPTQACSGHIHFDAELLDLQEYERYYMRNLADGRAYRWSGTTNFISLAAGEPAIRFRIERN